MKPIKVGLLGLGTVGSGVVRIVEKHQNDLQHQVGSPIIIEKVLVQDRLKNRDVHVDVLKLTEDPSHIIHNPEIDVVVEVMGGIEPAKSYILESLQQIKI
jgi:homoserine dehydrogenase